MTTRQPPQYQQQPYPQQQPPYYPPPQPVKRSGGCMKLVAIGAVVFLGLIVVTCYFAGKRAEEAREQERIATEQADTAILASIEKAKALYADGKLEEAVRELEGAAGNVSGSNDVRMQAHRLLDEYGKEYGRRFEAEVTTLLDKANEAITEGNADEAEKHLKAAVELRYAPNVEDARKLLATLREARSDEKMKSFMLAMSDQECTAFLNDLTLPDRAAFERPEIDAIFKATLKLNPEKARAWLEEGKAERVKELVRQQQELNAKMAEAEKAALDGKFTHDGYADANFVLIQDAIPVERKAAVSGWHGAAWNGHTLFAAVFALRGSDGAVVQRDTVVYFHDPSKPRSINSRYTKVIGFRQESFFKAATESVKPYVAGQPMLRLLFSDLIGESDAEKRLNQLVRSVESDFNGQVQLGAQSPESTGSDAVGNYQLRVTMTQGAANGTVATVDAVPLGFSLDFRAEK